MTRTAEAGALAPAEPMTVAQAIAAVEGRVDALVEARIAEFEAEIEAAIASGAMLELAKSDEDVEAVSDDRKKAKALQRTLDENRKELTRRVDALKNRIMGPYNKKIEAIEKAVTAMDDSVRPYLTEKQRLKDEEEARIRKERREAEEAAAAEKKKRDDEARAAREEEERLEREREQAKSKKKREELEQQLAQARQRTDEAEQKAEVAQSVADAAAAPVSTRAASASVRSVGGSSLGMRKEWTHEVTNPDELPAEAWAINHDWIKAQYANEEARRRIADKDGNPQLPGCRIFTRPVLAGR